MEYIGIKTIKDAYIDQLLTDNKIDKANEIISNNIDVPIFKNLEIYAESEPDISSINNSLSDITVDLLALDKEFVAIADKYETLMDNINTRLEAVQEELLIEENRIKDLNIICGNYNEFVSVKTLNYKYFSGNFSYYDNYTFYAYNNSIDTVNDAIKIIDVQGNGFEGNKYVYKDNIFLQELIDTSNREYMIDEHISTAYEYSRLTTDNNNLKEYPKDVNFDSEEALCTISLYSNKKIGSMKVKTDIDSIAIKDILYSNDNGNTYISCWNDEIKINDLTEIYNDSNYVYGTGIICFPTTQYLKITFKSNNTSDDSIAFTTLDTTIAEKPIDKIISLPEVKRHVIKINSLNILSGKYTTATMQTQELVGDPVESIAIFASEYIPSFFPDNEEYIKYTLSVNGIDYNVVPINSNREGIKVIRFSDITSSDLYVEYIKESIKTAKLTITINTSDGTSTPYISNLKICYGKAYKK